MWYFYLLSAVCGAVASVAVYILISRTILKDRSKAIIDKARLEAENIKQQKILQAKEKFLKMYLLKLKAVKLLELWEPQVLEKQHRFR